MLLVFVLPLWISSQRSISARIPSQERDLDHKVESKRTVLVAEDEGLLRMVIVEALGIVENIDVIEAPDGLAAYGEIVHKQPDLAIIDLLMPNMGGIELLETLNGNATRPPGLKVLVSTAFVRPGLDKKLRELGADLILTKPFPIEMLIEAVEGLIPPVLRSDRSQLRVMLPSCPLDSPFERPR